MRRASPVPTEARRRNSQPSGLHPGSLSAHLRPNAFVSFTRDGDSLRIEDHGDAHAYLSSDHVRQTAKRLIQRGIVPTETNYGGWLGAYHRALANLPVLVEPNRVALPGREKVRSNARPVEDAL